MEERWSLPGGYMGVGQEKSGSFFVIGLCGTEERTWQIARKKLADAAVFEDGFPRGIEFEAVMGGVCFAWSGRRWR